MEVGTVDANLLIYAYNAAAFQHLAARRWFSQVLSGTAPVYLPWSSIHAFVRIITNEKLFDPPLTPAQACEVVESWLGSPNVHLLEPGPRYWVIFHSLIVRYNVRGPDVTDAHLVALALEHDLTIFTADADFGRFSEVKTRNPLLL